MLKAAVPSADGDQAARTEPPACGTSRQDSRNVGPRAVVRRCATGLRASCFHSATMFSTIVTHRGALDHLDQPDLR